VEALPPTSGTARIVNKIMNKFDRLQSRPPVFGNSASANRKDRWGCGPREEINGFRQLEENMVAPKIEMGLKETSETLEDPDQIRKLGIEDLEQVFHIQVI
jgi:hypothetical protein